ncbi:MAG: hypothetical protein RI906_3342 [Pseudomonadota bacterium]|jgi:hypothetical protein
MTPRQKEAIEALREHGSISAAARALGLSRSGLQSLIRKAEVSPEEKVKMFSGRALQNARAMDPAIEDAMRAVGTGLVPSLAWIKTKPTDEVPGFSVMLRPDVGPEDIANRIKAVLADLPAAENVSSPDIYDEDLLTVYPIADAHIGMMSWGKETGEDYDTFIAASRLRNWIARAVDASPSSAHAVILDVGDLTHADDQTNQTPRSKHVLDVDTRHFRTLDMTITALSHSVDYALRKHAKVTVRILPGNHNPTSYLAVMFALAERYRNEPRVDVQKVPGEFWVHRFGQCLFAAHHGHGGKPERMVFFLADEYAKEWGQTRHRFLWTGHLHHHKSADIGGVTWEQLRAVTARDAHAVSNAYSARAQLQAITFHREHGEIQRVKVAA